MLESKSEVRLSNGAVARMGDRCVARLSYCTLVLDAAHRVELQRKKGAAIGTLRYIGPVSDERLCLPTRLLWWLAG